MNRPIRFAAALAAAIVLAAPAIAESTFSKSITDLFKGDDRAVPSSAEEITLSFAPLVKSAAPAVVNVYANSKVAQSPFFDDPFFGRFFGETMPPRVQSSLGSGVIVDATGIIVTNNHVVRDADEVKVALSDGREFESRVVLKDESVDLAILKIEAPDGLHALPIGDSDAMEVGDLVLAIGNPFGVGQTTTSGIVSALARSPVGVTDFGFFIQTDAAINPGNSGGALLNMRGELVGINTAIFSKSGGSVGIGFAIPSNMVRAVIASARDGSAFFERPWFGATFDLVTATVAEALGMERPTGALVVDVVKGGPADKAGIRAGDVVLGVNGVETTSPDGFGYRIATLGIGETATVTLLRQGKPVDIAVTLERAPEGLPSSFRTIDGQSPFAGSKVANMSPRLAQQLRLPENTTGVVVAEVDPRSPASQFIAPGDIVVQVNGADIGSVDDLVAAAAEDTRWWRFTLNRGGRLVKNTIRF